MVLLSEFLDPGIPPVRVFLFGLKKSNYISGIALNLGQFGFCIDHRICRLFSVQQEFILEQR
jgi:hypothetical protein